MYVILVIVVLFVLWLLFGKSDDTSRSSVTPLPPKVGVAKSNSGRTDHESVQSKIQRAIRTNSDITISYRNYDGMASKRRLSNIEFNNEFRSKGYNDNHIKGYCHMRKERRTFKIGRIESVEVIK